MQTLENLLTSAGIFVRAAAADAWGDLLESLPKQVTRAGKFCELRQLKGRQRGLEISCLSRQDRSRTVDAWEVRKVDETHYQAVPTWTFDGSTPRLANTIDITVRPGAADDLESSLVSQFIADLANKGKAKR